MQARKELRRLEQQLQGVSMSGAPSEAVSDATGVSMPQPPSAGVPAADESAAATAAAAADESEAATAAAVAAELAATSEGLEPEGVRKGRAEAVLQVCLFTTKGHDHKTPIRTAFDERLSRSAGRWVQCGDDCGAGGNALRWLAHPRSTCDGALCRRAGAASLPLVMYQ